MKPQVIIGLDEYNDLLKYKKLAMDNTLTIVGRHDTLVLCTQDEAIKQLAEKFREERNMLLHELNRFRHQHNELKQSKSKKW